jgi:serine/threonine protein phosphatase PrpC
MVADGMGGHAGGDVASTIAVTMLSALDQYGAPELRSTPASSRRVKLRPSVRDSTETIEKTIVQAYLAVLEAVKTNPELGGMGTTVTSLLMSDEAIVSAHLGDSRAYQLRNGEFSQMTTDHTFVQHLVDTGKITEEDARHHPQRNVVMRVLGDFEFGFDPDFAFWTISKGDRYFLCSDGVCGVLPDDEIKQVLETTVDPQEAADKLVEMALDAGSTDNCTAVVADVYEKKKGDTSKTPVFEGAAKETLQDALNQIVENARQASLEAELPEELNPAQKAGQKVEPKASPAKSAKAEGGGFLFKLKGLFSGKKTAPSNPDLDDEIVVPLEVLEGADESDAKPTDDDEKEGSAVAELLGVAVEDTSEEDVNTNEIPIVKKPNPTETAGDEDAAKDQ